ncbi:MAG: sulfite exporter TauE/SafE family protein [archaeon]|jgi:sulfite exporter TauE/SafE/copper chaperone CopZ
MRVEEHNEGRKVIKLSIQNMVCNSCEKIIEKSLGKLYGVHGVEVSYAQGEAEVKYSPKTVSVEKIINTIHEAGYSAEILEEEKPQKLNPSYIALGIIGAVILVFAYIAVSSTLGQLNISIPQLDAQTSIILIFIVGLLTGFHCIGMCGGFVLGYTATARKTNPKSLNLPLHAQYAIGKIISYTVIGGIFGLIGSIFVFTPTLRAIIAILAGIFLIIYGLKLLNIFPMLRKFSLPTGIFDKLKLGKEENSKNNGPLVIGLMNGLFIACGPLQAMYVLAATTGSIFAGGLLLLAFAIGTLIPMMLFGVFASFLSHGFQNNIVRLSAAIVIIMGILMINNGLALTGNAISFSQNISANGVNPQPGTNLTVTDSGSYTVDSPYQIIRMDVTNAGWVPNSFILKKGVPVKWIINGKELNGCNSGINVPAYNLNFSIKQGEQTIEFTPTTTGVIQWSCWMGMIQGTFVVRDDVGIDSSGNIVLSLKVQAEAKTLVASVPKKSGGCGCGGGNSCQMGKV